MCGRYTLKRSDRIALLGRDVLEVEWPQLQASYNVAPSQLLPVAYTTADGRPVAGEMRWGLIPFWARDRRGPIAPINARAEEALAKPMFRTALQRRRVLVPADGYYEWRKLSPIVKQPYHFQLRTGEPFFFPGLYEPGADSAPATFATLTTQPNALAAEIHNRMPVILDRENARAWLEPGEMTAERLATISRPYPAERMEVWPVDRAVGDVRNNSPELVTPLPESGQTTLFHPPA